MREEGYVRHYSTPATMLATGAATARGAMTNALLERAVEAAQRLSAHEKYQLIETSLVHYRRWIRSKRTPLRSCAGARLIN